MTIERLEERTLLATFTVLNTADSGAGSLRQAILDANAAPNTDTSGDGIIDADVIAFHIAADDAGHSYYQDDNAAGQVTLANVATTTADDDASIAEIDPDHPHSWYSIVLESALPNITDPVTIDGYTQPGASVNTNPVTAGSNAVLRIEISAPSISEAMPFTAGGNSTVRGLVLNRANVFIHIATDSNVIEGNFIGLDPSGTIGRGDGGGGVRIHRGDNNLVGGTTAAARNVISGHSGNGIEIAVAGTSGNTVQGNFIGTNAQGTAAILNFQGILINEANSTTVGGSTLAGRNVIQANNGIHCANDNGTTIQGNFVGTDVTGTVILGSAGTPIQTLNSSSLLIGGVPATPGTPPGNLITGGTGLGNIEIQVSRDITIQGNLIGTDATGTAPLGGVGGIWVHQSTATIGGTNPEERNIIAFNFLRGVFVTGDTSRGTILGNSIHSNGTLGIDLDPNPFVVTGVTNNDPGDVDNGPNGLQNFPVLTAAATDESGTTTIQGELNSTASTTFRIEFFANADLDLSLLSEGETLIGFTNVTTDESGNAAFTFITTAAVAGDRFITATATDPSGNTSEFSVPIEVSAIESIAVPRIVFNQAYVGGLVNSSATDRWDFGAVAGERVRLDVINASDPGTQFTLAGPDGPVFDAVTGDTGPITLTATGDYQLRVTGGVGAYRFRMEVEATDLVLGTPFNGTLATSGQAQLFRLPVATTQNLLIELGSLPPGHNELYAKIGSAPTRTDFLSASTEAGQTGQELAITNAAPGDWFILVYAESVPTPGPFQLLASTGEVIVTSVSPNPVNIPARGGLGQIELTIEGAGLGIVDDVVLVAPSQLGIPGARFSALELQTSPPDRLIAFFPQLQEDVYALELLTSDVRTIPVRDIRVFHLEDSEPNIITRLILPSALGRHATGTLYVEYENHSAFPIPAPLLVLRSDDADDSDKPLLTLDESLVPAGFWAPIFTSVPDGFSHSAQILAGGSSPGILQPFERGRVPVYYVGLLQPFDSTDTSIEFAIDVVTQSSTTAFDLAASKDSLRPAHIDPEAWDAIFANFLAEVSVNGVTTVGAYVAMLNRNARYLGRLGDNVTEVGQLFGFELAQADGLHPLRTLANGTDASVPAPGLSLQLSRMFPHGISSRYRLGPLGRGWSHTWETRLDVEPNGTVTVTLAGGRQRRFQPDLRSAAYFSAAGDHGTLRRLGSEFELREANGLLQKFKADGSLDFIEDLNGNRITASYTGELLTRLDHSSGQFLDIAYDSAGRIESVTDSDGRVTRYTYDASNQHLDSVQSFDGRVTRYTYHLGGAPQTHHALTSIETPNGVVRSYEYDNAGRLASTFLNDGVERFDYTFDREAGVTATDGTGAQSTLFMNNVGLVARLQDALGNLITIGNDDDFNVSRLVDPAGQIYTFEHDSRGNLTSVTDPLGHIYQFGYSSHSRLTSFRDAKGNLTQYGYDAHGNLITDTDAAGNVRTIAYDAIGNLISYTNRRGRVIALEYNTDARLTRRTYEDGTSADFGYDDRGRLVSTVDEHGTTTFEYDSGDRLRRVSYPGGRFLEYTYDAAGRRTRMDDQDGFTVNYFYDAAGRLTRLTDAAGTTIVRYSYDVAGRLARRENGNGTFATYEYDLAGQLLHLVNRAPDGSINSRFDYTYDSLGQPTSMGTLDGAWTYEYDTIGRLTRAVFDSVNAAIPDQDLTYIYDAMGNRIRAIENGVVAGYATNALNQYTQVGSASYTYDADGNLTSIVDGVHATALTFDDEGQLVGVTMDGNTTSYEYNALNHRIATVDNADRREFLNDLTGIMNLVAEYNGSGSLVAHYSHGLGLTNRVEASGAAFFYDFDGSGSTAGLTGTAGDYLNQYRYRPFGELVGISETVANPFRYVGGYGVTSDRNGLRYMRARYYMPVDARFAHQDPLGLAASVNLYSYANNQPTRYIDPLGLGPLNTPIDWNEPDPWEPGTEPDIPEPQTEPEIPVRPPVPEPSGEPVFEPPLPAPIPKPDFPGFPRPGDLATVLPVIALASGVVIVVLACRNAAGCVGGLATAAIFIALVVPDEANADTGASEAAGSIDPNAKTTIAGFGPANFVNATAALNYRIDLENDATATAPAQRVDVTDQLSTNLEWNTFEFAELAFGDTIIAIPPGSQFFHTTVDVNLNNQEFQVEIDLDFESQTGRIRASFQSIDPTTGLPPDVLTGFLSPEDGTGRGQGHFNYTIRPVAGLATSTEIRNVGTIRFDFQETIDTNLVDPHDPSRGTDPAKEALVTIDAGAPSSSVDPLAVVTNSPSVLVSWSGTDDADSTPGSGIRSFDIFVSDNGSPFELLLDDTTEASTTFAGEDGHVYSFFSRATDHVGHEQSAPATAQATIQFDRTAPVLVNSPPNQTLTPTSPAGAMVTFVLPSATDAIDPSPAVACSPSSGSVFPIGTTTVTCTATDDAGNISSTNFTVTVELIDGPQVIDVRLPGKGKSIRSVILGFDKELSRVEAERLENYEIRSPGKDKRFGTRDDKLIALRDAVYDATANEVTLTLAKKLKVNRAFQITVQDTLTDVAGTPLDGDSDGIPGGDHIVRGGRWSHIAYFDDDGDEVKIRLVNRAALSHKADNRFDMGEPAGWMEVLWGPAIERRLLLTHTVPGQTVLMGSVKRVAGSDGVTTLESIVGTSGVENRLTSPPFVMRTIAADIVDALLETDALQVLPEF